MPSARNENWQGIQDSDMCADHVLPAVDIVKRRARCEILKQLIVK